MVRILIEFNRIVIYPLYDSYILINNYLLMLYNKIYIL